MLYILRRRNGLHIYSENS